MEQLMEAARTGSIEHFYAAIRSKPDVLDGIDEKLFVETPLHIAASVGNTQFALEMVSLKPSMGKKLNLDGLSPLHLALQNGHSDTVKRLVALDSELVHVKGRGGMTPLHYAVRQLKEIMKT
ncbi:Ankyrin repeat-containing protein BDA1 [Camellia lanceoleosa]|nr:Ankyrin repeat-containing protein BDA1 [Camellia lanceoleosa]